MKDKISKPKTYRSKEDEYFAEQELKKRKALREKLDQERELRKQEQAKNPNWMKCPKCGGQLHEISYEDVMVDKCDACNGIYLDAGELELLLGAKRPKGFFSKFMEALGGTEE